MYILLYEIFVPLLIESYSRLYMDGGLYVS